MSSSSTEHEKIGRALNKSNAMPYRLVHDNLTMSKDHLFFANLNLDDKALQEMLAPFMELAQQRISSAYKSPTKISFQGINGIFKLKLSDWLQFDDLCIKLVHVASGNDVLITISTQIARTLLIRLLSTTLVDDTHGVLFSSTEKGILAFIITRLLLDLKHTLGAKMPDLKLLGIYHCQDDSINDTAIIDYGVFNFSFSFAHDHYPVAIALPTTIFNSIKPQRRSVDVVSRCGHFAGPMTFALATLAMSQQTVATLSFGDVILFDRTTLWFSEKHVHGTMHGVWQGIAVHGNLTQQDGRYVFLPRQNEDFAKLEDITMEDIEIAGAHSDDVETMDVERPNRKLADLAKNIRVPLSIELARIPITLKELCQIQEGEILDLHRKIDEPLQMVVEGKPIGLCQPVQIDGRLGIRVLAIDGDAEEKA